MNTGYSPDIVEKLAEVLSRRPKAPIVDITRKPSAVLIPIYFQSGEYYIIFTRRTELVHHHKGEISFPGGGFQKSDGTLLNTALRESFEEIGLEPRDVMVIGELDDMVTKGSPYIITPFVGSIQPEYKFKLSVFEISELIEIPMNALLTEGCRREEPLELIGGRQVTPYVYAYNGKLVIGATARILKQFLEFFVQVTT
jgi:8-oxo-dGTP pyrophosphatase MutT (NUDIX family)